MAAGLHAEHAAAVLGVVEGHPLDKAGQGLAVGCLTLDARSIVLQATPPFGPLRQR